MKKFLSASIMLIALMSGNAFAGVSCADSDECMQLGYTSMANDDLKSASIYFREALKLSAQDCAQNRISKIECNQNMDMAAKQISMINTLQGSQGAQVQGHVAVSDDKFQTDKKNVYDLVDIGNDLLSYGNYTEALSNFETAASISNRMCQQTKSSEACNLNRVITRKVIEIKNNNFYKSQKEMDRLNENCSNAFSRMLHPVECTGLFR